MACNRLVAVVLATTGALIGAGPPVGPVHVVSGAGPVAARQQVPDGSAPEDPHYAQAVAEAQRLLAAAPVPPGAVAFVPASSGTGPPPFNDHVIDDMHEWTVAVSLEDAYAWVEAHPPAGLTAASSGRGEGPSGVIGESQSWSAPDTDAYITARLALSVDAAGPDRSLVRAEGSATWLTTAPAPDTTTGPRIHITAAQGCPTSIKDVADVANPPRDVATRLLPRESPSGALICRYSRGRPDLSGLIGLVGQGPPAGRTTLGVGDAAQLARAIDRIRLGWAGPSIANCPNDQALTDVLVFTYQGRPDIDLWYHAGGCQFLDNGFIEATEIANPSFYNGFLMAMNRVP